jgi:poly(beta-D-mannuronate) lyase
MIAGRVALGLLFCSLLAGPVIAACPPAPPAVRNLASNTFYSDSRHSIVDPARMAQYRRSVKPLEDFESEIARFASRAQQGQGEWGVCTGHWLALWARDGALLGAMSGTGLQAQYVRNWALAGLAMAYVRAGKSIAPTDRAPIEAWLVKVAEAVDGQFGRKMSRKRRNNHFYWLGFALAAAGEAGHSEPLRQRARAIYEEALGHIAPDGHLPREAERGARALHYHNFSVLPLVMIAELAALRGEERYAMQGGALHRLIRFTLDNYHDPRPLQRLANTKPEPLAAKEFGWFPLYAARFPARVTKESALADQRYWVRWAGGDMNLLAKAWRQ